MLLLLFFINPQFANWKIASAELRERRTELNLKKVYFANLAKIAQELNQYPEEIAKIDSAIPNRPFLPSVFNFLEVSATENGLILEQIGKFSVLSNKERSNIKESFIDITFNGLYPDFKNFISAVEKSARIVNADNVVLDLTKTEDDLITFDLKIKSNSY